MIDSKGRLFGKISILDLGAALVILLVIIGIFFFPSSSGGSIAQVSGTKPMEVDILVRGLSVRDPDAFIGQMEEEKKIDIVIRNQPAGQLEIKSIQPLPRTTPVPQPDGSVKALPDPRPEVVFIKDMIITAGGNAQISDNGPVLGGKKVKIGHPIQLSGSNYDFNGSIMGVRLVK